MSSRRFSTEQLTALAQQHSAAPPPAPLEQPPGVKIERLRAIDVDIYEKNPRHKAHSAFEELKASIRVEGITQMLTVTRRPGADRWVLYAGGGNRLRVAQELAAEDPNKWTWWDFVVRPYTSEAAILAAHLSENLQREQMSFWDTATGIVEMRAIREEETGTRLSAREFETYLEEMGLSDAKRSQSVQLLEFSALHLNGLGNDLCQEIGRDHALRYFRPLFSNLLDLWTKHDDLANEAFAKEWHLWLQDYVQVHAIYDVDAICNHIKSCFGEKFDYEADELEHLIAALKVNPKATLQELKRPKHAAQEPATAGSPAPGQDQGLANLAKSLGGHAGQTQDEAPPGGAGDDDAYLPPALGSGSSGLKVRTGLVPDANSTANQGTSEQQQDTLPGLSGQEIAKQALMDAVAELAEIASISATVVSAPLMPFGFIVEGPAPGALGDSLQELPLQAWWLLANFSGQVDLTMLESNRLPLETEFTQALANEDSWPEFVTERLGGESVLDAAFVLSILTSPAHPLSAAALAVVQAMHAFNAQEVTK